MSATPEVEVDSSRKKNYLFHPTVSIDRTLCWKTSQTQTGGAGGRHPKPSLSQRASLLKKKNRRKMSEARNLMTTFSILIVLLFLLYFVYLVFY